MILLLMFYRPASTGPITRARLISKISRQPAARSNCSGETKSRLQDGIKIEADGVIKVCCLIYKRNLHSLLTNRTPFATEKNLLRCVCQPVLHVASASPITKSNLKGGFRKILEPSIIGPGVVAVNVFAIVGFIFHHLQHCGCDDGLVTSEKS